MQKLPHRYLAAAATTVTGNVDLTGTDLPSIESAPPAEFGGPGDRWSPETLLVAAVADCFVLTFKAIARASKLEWLSISCNACGVLDRVDNTTQFTEFRLQVVLNALPGTDETKAMRLLEKSEAACLITNSLKSTSHLDAEVKIAESPQ